MAELVTKDLKTGQFISTVKSRERDEKLAESVSVVPSGLPTLPGRSEVVSGDSTALPGRSNGSTGRDPRILAAEETARKRALADQPGRRITTVSRGASFASKRGALYQGFKHHPIDVKVVLKVEYGAALILAWVVMQLCNVRLFIDAICNGYCNQQNYDERTSKCLHCDWFHVQDGAAYCRGCSCPSWAGSKLTLKKRLARFRCPKGMFGHARGWVGRILGAASYSCITPTVENK